MSAEPADLQLFDPDSLRDCPWMADLVDVPDDAAWPRLMTPPHPDAVSSYGPEADEWIAAELGLKLRWWQRLATRRQLECDADGVLVWRQVLESTPRRSGKSVRLRAMALWRVAHADLFGEEQLVLHTGKDLPICKEIHRRAWRWAESRGWGVRRLNGHEEVSSPDGSRWLVRGKDSVFGYDTCLGMVDEAWDIAPTVVDDGLEPSVLERSMPQIVLTSTAHRHATSLMRRRIDSALAGMGEDFSTLLMLWGAGPGADIGDPVVWRAASPHWTRDRAVVIAGKFERAMRGEADPDADDPDPIEGFKAQYLNVWPGAAERRVPGEPVVTEVEWGELNGYQAAGVPVVAAVEAWFQQGAAMSTATRLPDGRVGVSSVTFPDVPSAVEAARGSGAATVLVGKSLAAGLVGVEPVGGTTRQAVLDLRRFVDDGVLVHDSSPALAEQVLALRTALSSDGPRLVSKGRADCVKSAAWAVARAQQTVEMAAIY